MLLPYELDVQVVTTNNEKVIEGNKYVASTPLFEINNVSVAETYTFQVSPDTYIEDSLEPIISKSFEIYD